MSARRPITNSRPPAFVSRETGAAELDLPVREWDGMVALGLLPAPNANGRWVWADVERAVLSRQAPVRRTEGTVYFIGFANYVKIGFTFNSVADRVAVLQIGAPETLIVFAQERGTMTREHELHRRFAAYRTRGEWFRREGALADYIASLKAVDHGDA